MMCKRIWLYFFLLMLCSAMPAAGQFRTLGVGGMIGSPTGFSIKQWTSRKSAIVLGAAWSMSRNPGIHLHGDILRHRSDFDGMQAGQSYVYYGVGGRLKAAIDDPRAGIRFPLGFTFIDQDEPIDAFVEIVPIMDILPESRFAMNVSVGGRFYLSGNRRRFQ